MSHTSDWARQIYLAHFGHLDNKYFQATKQQEIQDWLDDGDLEDSTLQQCIDEWAVYDADDIARQN